MEAVQFQLSRLFVFSSCLSVLLADLLDLPFQKSSGQKYFNAGTPKRFRSIPSGRFSKNGIAAGCLCYSQAKFPNEILPKPQNFQLRQQKYPQTSRIPNPPQIPKIPKLQFITRELISSIIIRLLFGSSFFSHQKELQISTTFSLHHNSR